MTRKLEETFNLPAENSEMLAELEARYDSSDDPDLKEVARMALDAYKEIMLDVMNYDVKYKARQAEVAQTFLNLAKDALAKDRDLNLKEEKQNDSKKDDDPEAEQTFDRDQFLVELNKKSKAV